MTLNVNDMSEKKYCDLCGGLLKKGRRRFCCTKHKDQYHNEHNPRGIFAHLAEDEHDDYKYV